MPEDARQPGISKALRVAIQPCLHSGLVQLRLAQPVARQWSRYLQAPADIVDKVLKRDVTVLFGVRRVLELEQVYLCLHDGGLLDLPDLCKSLTLKRPTGQLHRPVGSDASHLPAHALELCQGSAARLAQDGEKLDGGGDHGESAGFFVN